MFGLTPYERRNNDLMFFSPFKELEDMEKRFFGDRMPVNFKTDIRDTGKEFVLEAELPGFDKSDIGIDVKDGYLTITATHSEENDEKDKKGNYLRRERSYGSMTRSFDVSDIEENAITASFNNGVLELILPKKEDKAEVSRKIEIN
ncbi:MAG: Hsp20/alpha crystallin family protein [Acutalibacteraceae bacterium]